VAIAYVQRQLTTTTPEQSALPSSAPAPAGPPVRVPVAASNPGDGSRAATPAAIAIGFGIVALGGLLAYIGHSIVSPAPFKVGSDISVFAALFVTAAAVERILEPVSRFFGNVEAAKSQRDRAVVAMEEDGGQEAASSQAALNQQRANRAVMVWGLATAVSMMLSAVGGFHLLYSIAAPGAAPPVGLDVLLTGLVIGSGTKPLHDLVTRVQRSKEKAEDPPETRG
jgi:hypothetical protein